MFVAYFLPYGYYNMLQISTKVTSIVTQRDWALTFCAELFQLAPQKKNYAFALRRLNKECRMILQPIHFPIIAFQTDSTTSAVIEIITWSSELTCQLTFKFCTEFASSVIFATNAVIDQQEVGVVWIQGHWFFILDLVVCRIRLAPLVSLNDQVT